MSHMHVLYAHDHNWTFRLESLTPDDVWDVALKNSEHLVTVYDAASKTVRRRPLKELVANRVPYRSRGWCKAEVEWSSCRSKSEQNQWIDAPESEAGGGCAQLQGKVPMTPELFQEDMRKAEFTHRDDAVAVLELQRKIFHQKVSECQRALRANLPKGELSQLAKALIHYKKLKVLHLRNMDVCAAEAEEFAKVLAMNSTITELEISVAGSVRAECGAFWKSLVEMLKSNATITSLNLGFNGIGDDFIKALAETLATNSTLTSVDLRGNSITSEGCKGLAKALKTNGSITTLDLRQNDILAGGFKAFAEALTTNRTITTINLDYNGSGHEWLWELQEIFKTRKESTVPIVEDAAAAQSHVWTGEVRIQTLASRLKSNSITTRLGLESNFSNQQRIGVEGIKALALALKTNRTITKISLKDNYMEDEGCKALRCAGGLSSLDAPSVPCEALADALVTNGALASIDLGSNGIGDEGCKA
ncbi:Nlrc3 [Symbiodinium necroappetens]|uniref:Nlrc3 protein n=1 Tax=Symbiodinium necroappetens TaxID=1628268 RepID=A0A812YJQ1_9DINO|nr:Nlrc3 [Symbiodinium necroappetens]